MVRNIGKRLFEGVLLFCLAVLLSAAGPEETQADQVQGYILPASAYEYLTYEEIASLPLQVVCYAKNEIYARYGRKFVSTELQNYFNAQNWYYPIYEPDQFPSDCFNAYETANVDLLASREAELGTYVLDSASGYSYDAVYQYMVNYEGTGSYTAGEAVNADTAAEKEPQKIQPFNAGEGPQELQRLNAGEKYSFDVDGDGQEETLMWEKLQRTNEMVVIVSVNEKNYETFSYSAEWEDPYDTTNTMYLCDMNVKDEGPDLLFVADYNHYAFCCESASFLGTREPKKMYSFIRPGLRDGMDELKNSKGASIFVLHYYGDDTFCIYGDGTLAVQYEMNLFEQGFGLTLIMVSFNYTQGEISLAENLSYPFAERFLEYARGRSGSGMIAAAGGFYCYEQPESTHSNGWVLPGQCVQPVELVYLNGKFYYRVTRDDVEGFDGYLPQSENGRELFQYMPAWN